MTCIVGVIENGKVYMGADRMASSDYMCYPTFDSKLIKREDEPSGSWLFGICGSFRTLELLKYELELPEPKKTQTPRHYMATTFVQEVRKCFKEHGLLSKNGNESDDSSSYGEEFYGDFLVAHEGLLYCLQSDFSLVGSNEGYMATGSGSHQALGSLYTTEYYKMSPEERLEIALEAASHHVPSVGPPFNFEVL